MERTQTYKTGGTVVLARFKVIKMKKEYDFSTGVRGKFYHKDLALNLPVYLEPENLRFVENITNLDYS